MTISLHRAGYEQAERLVKKGLEIEHERSDWQECKPDANDAAKFLNTHELTEYGSWFLGIDAGVNKTDKEHYVYPYGDFNMIHVGALEAIRDEAGRMGHNEIKRAAERLLSLIDRL